MRLACLIAILVPGAFAANQPTFTHTFPAATTISAIAVDINGNTYVTGSTTSITFPTTSGGLQTQFSGGNCVKLGTPGGGTLMFPCSDAFVVKFDPGGAVLFSTYFGGNGAQTAGSAISVDSDGSVYVGGTSSPNNLNQPDTFPVTSGAAFTKTTDGFAFVAKLSGSGNSLIYSTLLPVSTPATVMMNGQRALAMAIDSQGEAYVASTTQGGLMFPTTPGAFQSTPQNSNAAGAVMKLNAAGSVLLYATYLSGNSFDVTQGIAIDAAGDAFITGYTESQNFPATPGAFEPNPSGTLYAGFLTKLNPQGTALVYSTFLGEANGAGPWEIKVDTLGGAYVLGQGSPVVSYGGFLSHLSPDGSTLIYSAFLPTASGLDLDVSGSAFVAGVVSSAVLETAPGAFQPSFGGGSSDAFAVKITPNGQVAGATYLGGSLQDVGTAIAVTPNGAIVIAGTTQSSDFPGLSAAIPSNISTGFITSIVPWLIIENAASFNSNAIAPGEIVTLRGYGMGPQTAAVASGPSLPTILGGVQVTFGGILAPLFSVQSQQVSAQVPWEMASPSASQVTVSYNDPPVTSSVIVVSHPTAPGIYAVSNSDGSENSPLNPAKAGDFVSIYGTGGGAMNSPGVTGAVWPITTPLPVLSLPISVTIGGDRAEILYAGAAPTLESGYFQVNAVVPATLPSSPATKIYLTVGGASTLNGTVTIAIR